MDRQSLLDAFSIFSTAFPEEEKFIAPFIELLKHKDCFQRTHLPGHITGSAWIVNGDRTKTLLVHHVKLNKWVQPGGHADGEENILNVALREAEEETGLKNLNLSSAIFDIDIHPIPTRKDFPEHLHYDIRFWMEGAETEKIVVSEESHDVRWVLLEELERFTRERSVLRMRDKTMLIHG